MRYSFRIHPLALPLLLVLGARRSRSFAEIGERDLHVRFGPHFDERLAFEEIAQVLAPAWWPLIGGIGWRTNFMGAIGLIGSAGETVLVRLAKPRRVRMFFVPVTMKELYLSLEQPLEFADALRARLRP